MIKKYNEREELTTITQYGFSFFKLFFESNNKSFFKSSFVDAQIVWSELRAKFFGTMIGPIRSSLDFIIEFLIGIKADDLMLKNKLLLSLIVIGSIISIPVQYVVNFLDLLGSLLATLKDSCLHSIPEFNL
jgi:hypothetical protein